MVIPRLFELLHQVRELQIDDGFELFLAERLEEHDIVHAVQEFRAEKMPQSVESLFAGFFRIAGGQFEDGG